MLGRSQIKQSHENLATTRPVAASSDRKFGITVGLILAAAALWPAVRHGQAPRLLLLVPGALLFGAGLGRPRLLAPLNRLWFRFGLLLAAITNPVVMGILYAVAIVPIGAILRFRKTDLLLLRPDPEAASYWIERGPSPPGPLTKQF